MPQLSTDERNSVTTSAFISDIKAKGLTIFNKSNNRIEYWNGERWITLYEIKASNGLNHNDENFELGGRLSKATTVAMETNSLDFSSKGGNFTVGGTGLSVNSAKQVGIGTATPNKSAALDITATNKGFLLPRIALKGTNDISTIPNPAIGLLVYNTVQAGLDKVRVLKNKIYSWNGTKWSLMIDEDTMNASVGGVVDGLGIPRPAVFQLESTQENFLKASKAGESQQVPMALVTNNISNSISFNKADNAITFQAGTYIISFIYEGLHNESKCTISSYFIDFPTSSTMRRIHTTASHSQGPTANHGGTITYTAKLTKSIVWIPKLGRGQSGNCYGDGMTLNAYVTQLSILKISN